MQANWPSVLYPQAAIAAAGLGGAWRRWRAPAAGLGFALTALVWVQGIWAPAPLPRRLDITAMRLAGWDAMAAEVTAAARREGAHYVVADNYGQAAELAWRMPADIPVLALDTRWYWFDLPSAAEMVIGQPGLMLRSDRLVDQPHTSDFAHPAELGEIARGRGGMVAERLRFYRVVGRAGFEPIVVLPRPRR